MKYMIHEILNSVGYASVIVFYITGALIILKITNKKRTRTQKLRDIAGRFSKTGYKLHETYDGRWI